jgi:hypothetical protein
MPGTAEMVSDVNGAADGAVFVRGGRGKGLIVRDQRSRL